MLAAAARWDAAFNCAFRSPAAQAGIAVGLASEHCLLCQLCFASHLLVSHFNQLNRISRTTQPMQAVSARLLAETATPLSQVVELVCPGLEGSLGQASVPGAAWLLCWSASNCLVGMHLNRMAHRSYCMCLLWLHCRIAVTHSHHTGVSILPCFPGRSSGPAPGQQPAAAHALPAATRPWCQQRQRRTAAGAG